MCLRCWVFISFQYNEVDLKSAWDSFERYERGFVQTKEVIMLINLL